MPGIISPVKKLLIFRHGETDWNVEQRFQGHMDVPLNDTGRTQAAELALRLREHKLEAILSSDLSRARETAEIAALSLGGIPIHVDARLREAHLGEAQGLTRQEIEQKLGIEVVERWASWHATDADVSYPGGEKGSQVLARILEALIEFAVNQPYERFGVATHGGSIRRLMSHLKGGQRVPIPNGVLYQVRFDPVTGRFEALN